MPHQNTFPQLTLDGLFRCQAQRVEDLIRDDPRPMISFRLRINGRPGETRLDGT